MSKESVVEVEDELDEERVESMIEFERELLEEQRERELQGEAGKGSNASGTVRVVNREYEDVRVEFFVEGEVWTDTVSRPDDPSDPEEELNRLCRVCDVPLGMVSELQGERVPVVWDEDGEEYKLQLPETVQQPALFVYQVWWWGRRQGIDMGKVKPAVIGSGLFTVMIYGWYVWWKAIIIGHEYDDPSNVQEIAHITPFVEGAMIEGFVLSGLALNVFFLAGVGSLFMSLFLTLFGVLVVGGVISKVWNNRVWPF